MDANSNLHLYARVQTQAFICMHGVLWLVPSAAEPAGKQALSSSLPATLGSPLVPICSFLSWNGNARRRQQKQHSSTCNSWATCRWSCESGKAARCILTTAEAAGQFESVASAGTRGRECVADGEDGSWSRGLLKRGETQGPGPGRVLKNCQPFGDKDLRHPGPRAVALAALKGWGTLIPRPSQKLPHQLLQGLQNHSFIG